ncbi:MAG: energy-coupling factor ABC transporter ATP-binding protein, partial [Gemmatimonadota bacterium]|nr:energy-coupling factor ABC transporter ATP-binding protein [Gemmatimonadota bacterium]
CVTGVIGGRTETRTLLLRALAGLEYPSGGKITFTGLDGATSSGPSTGVSGAACLPPPGEEMFVGTTVDEELDFYIKAGGLDREEAFTKLEQIGTYGFNTIRSRSVWELSDSERRLLLLVSQALAQPAAWLCDEPFALLDAERLQEVRSLLESQARKGAVVVVTSADAGDILEMADRLLVLSPGGGATFQGKAADLPAETARAEGWDQGLRRAAIEARKPRIGPGG